MKITTVLFFWIVGLVAAFLLLSQQGYCATTARPNGLGVLQTYENQYTYMVGSPARVGLFEHNGNYYTNVGFKAFGASMLNTETILFCGDLTGTFTDGRLRVVVYRTQAAHAYQGVGCHDILRVMFIVEETQLP